MNRRQLFRSLGLVPAAFVPQRPQLRRRYRRALVVDGNSISCIHPLYWPGWVAQFLTDPWARLMGFAGIVTAVGGATIAECTERAPAMVDPVLDVADETWLIVFEVRNALNTAPDPVGVFQQHKDYCLARRAAGFTHIGIATGLSGDPAQSNYTYAQLCQLNTLIREQYRDFADFVLDFAAVPEMGAERAFADRHWFQDGVHPSTAGRGLLAQMAAAELKRQVHSYYVPMAGR